MTPEPFSHPSWVIPPCFSLLTLPVDHLFSLASSVTAPLPPLSGLALFLIVFFSLVFSVFAIVIGIILYNKWQDQSRKRFY